MTAKNRTSNKHKKPGQYVDQSAAAKESHAAFVAQSRARKFKAIRSAKVPTQPSVQAASAVAANTMNQKQKASASAADDDEDEDEQDASGDEDADDADAASAAGSNSAASASASAAASSSSAAAAASSSAPSDFSVSFTPFVSSDSSAMALPTDSSLKDDRVLGVALWEWLLLRLDWDCHTLWEKFLRDWDLITETERPPGTNRPINLHSYLTYLRSTNNKAVVRKDVRTCRDTLLAERTAYAQAHPEDETAQMQVDALNGTILSYYLKVKRLIPYESQAQRKRKEAAAKRKREQQQQQQPEGKEESAADGEATAAAADEVEEVTQAPKRRKTKFAAPTPASTAEAIRQAARNPRPATGSMQLGQANSFAALLDCD